MNYLLDTHYMLWAIADSSKISKKIKDILRDPDKPVLVSAISFWEVSLKVGLGKLEIRGFFPEDLPEICSQIGFEIIELAARDSSSYHHLKAVHHKDTFDRMLIWQAISNDYTLISADMQVSKYRSEGLKLLTG
jgi:PIN domain nuclease of toxin-antitoxin system